MPLLRLDTASLHYGTQVLLDEVDLTITRGDRLGLLGRNGTGKTTLLKILAGELQPDSGERWLRPGVRLARLQQELPEGDELSVYEVVASGLADAGRLVAEYHRLVHDGNATDLDQLARVQQQLENVDGWTLQQRVDTVISQLQLPPDASMGQLSGGWRRRVALAQALVCDPDILLLDEPTAALDPKSAEVVMQTAEKIIADYRLTTMLITHNMRETLRFGNRIIHMAGGRVVRDVDAAAKKALKLEDMYGWFG